MNGDSAPGFSAFTVIVGVGLSAALFITAATIGLGAYGWMAFVGAPFVMGFVISVIAGEHGATFLRATVWALAAMAVCAVVLLTGRLEGLICVVMALPLAGPVVIGGVVAGWLASMAIVVLAAPGGLAVDASRTATAPLHAVVTAVEIDASPERVWPHVVSFTELPPPTEWIFRGGVAHPLRLRIDGRGVGAVRYCEFSTGAFVEPITVWDAPRRLAFNVATSPSPLSELNPFGDVHPPHLEGYLASERGEFRLEPLPGGRTRLVGTTWYRHHMFPDRYWQAWSDSIIHRIHRRVLHHIEGLAEAR
jgi:hypothetical protein